MMTPLGMVMVEPHVDQSPSDLLALPQEETLHMDSMKRISPSEYFRWERRRPIASVRPLVVK